MAIFVHTTDGRTYSALIHDHLGEDETLTNLLESTRDFTHGWIRVHDESGHDAYIPYTAVVRITRGDQPDPTGGR